MREPSGSNMPGGNWATNPATQNPGGAPVSGGTPPAMGAPMLPSPLAVPSPI